MNLWVTAHAVQQFVSRWRPITPTADARRELLEIAASAKPLKRRPMSGDCTLYVAITTAGERICLCVRDGGVITVLPDRGEHDDDRVDLTPSREMIEDSNATVAACRAMVACGRSQNIVVRDIE